MNGDITMNSRLKEVWGHPVGKDVLQKLLMTFDLCEGLIDNPLTGGLPLKAVAALTHKTLGEEFWKTFLHLLNRETDRPGGNAKGTGSQWWKEAVFYQIYPRSFKDADGDGVGDLKGIIEKLDYLKRLGIDALWLSPVYDSPDDDNGYDIRNYYSIQRQFGTMEEFDRLLREVHKRGMRLIMDLVVNHTSDEHDWFQKALKDPSSPYRSYYFFKEGREGEAPNNWTSFFGGSAWNYYDKPDEWALHLFSKKQMDLNWDNPDLRADIIAMIRWWLKMGVDGFRMDVINYISKEDGLADGNGQIGSMLGYYGIEHYFYGPRLHEYLREIRGKAFEPFEAFSIGETPGVGMEMAKLLTGEERGELDMVFNFDHLETPGHTRFEDYRYDLCYLKEYYTDWMEHYADGYWMSLFYENHDNPRMISKVNPDGHYREAIGKLLAAIQFMLRGTPFIYQGQELGAVNEDFTDISQLRDVESLNLYRELTGKMSKEEAFSIVLAGTRDHARSMIRWEEADEQRKDRDSIYYFYKKLIALRKKYPALIYGDIEFLYKRRKELFAWVRRDERTEFYIECNLTERLIKRPVRRNGFKGILSNYCVHEPMMKAYEVCLYRREI